jgi:hypothetical protein
MRAIVLDQPGSLRVATVPDPAPGPGEVKPQRTPVPAGSIKA